MQKCACSRLFLVLVVTLLTRVLTAAPAIVTPPTPVSVASGQQVSLNVVATGTGTLSYQWHRNGFPLAAKTAATLTFPAALSEADDYHIVVTDSTGATASAPVRVSVAPASYPEALRLDPAFELAVESELGGSITAIADAGGGKILVAGDFVRVDGNASIRRLARFDVATGALDTTFAPAINGTINAIAVQSDGRIVIGGAFNLVNGLARNNVARLNASGSTDLLFNLGSGASGTVNSLALQTISSEQKILAGGSFSNFSGASPSRPRLVRLNANGSVDTGFNANVVSTSSIAALAVQPDGRILVGGTFTAIGGVTVSNLARLTTTGAIDTTFNHAGGVSNTGVVGTVNALALDDSGRILVGGALTSYNGSPVADLLRLSSTGVVDAFSGAGGGPNNTVNVIALDHASPKRILIGGSFTSYGTTSGVNRFVRIAADTGALDATFLPKPGGTVLALCVPGSSPAAPVIFGGSFSAVNNQFARLLAKASDAGVRDTTFAHSFRVPGTVNAIKPVAGGKYIVAGNFNYLGGAPVNHLARLHANLTVDFTFNSARGSGYSTAIVAIDSPPSGTPATAVATVAAGQITAITVTNPGNGYTIAPAVTISGTGAGALAFTTLNATGGVGSITIGAPGPGAQLTSVAVQGDGKLVIGGGFTTYNGAPASRVARLTADGALDLTYGAGASSGVVNTVIAQSAGRILIGGNFTNANNASPARPALAQLEADGTTTALALGALSGGSPSTINAIAIQPSDGKIVVGGNFTTIGGNITRNRLARVDGTTGAVDSTTDFAIGSGPGSVVRTVAVDSSHRILVGGDFTSFDGLPASRYLRLTSTGTLDVAGTASSNVHHIQPQPDGRALLLGTFGNLVSGGPVNTNTFARLNADGAVDPAMGVHALTFADLGFSSAMSAAAVLDNGDVLLGGRNFTVSGQERLGLVKLTAAAAPTIASVSTSSIRPGATITITGSHFLDVTAVRFNGANGLAATSYAVVSPTQITATVPLGAVSGPVSVQTLYGTATSSTRLGIAPDFALRAPFGSAGTLLGVAVGKNAANQDVYVAVGSPGDILSSSDAITWTSRFNSHSVFLSINAVTYANGTFTAVGNSGTIMTSSDGIDWIRRTPTNTSTSANFTGVTYGAGKFVAVSSSSTVAVSTDGLAWEVHSGMPSASAVAFGDSRFVSVGSGGAIRTSSDGQAWTSQSSPTSAALAGVAYANGGFMAVGASGAVLTSPDGLVWSPRSAPVGGSGNNLSDVAYASGRWVTSVTNGAGVFYSDNDGASWTAASANAGSGTRAILHDGTQFVLVGVKHVSTSPNGTSWTLRNTSTNGSSLHEVVYGNGRYIAVGASSAFATSTDAVAWSSGRMAESGFLNMAGVAYGRGLFVAVGGTRIQTTIDGSSWDSLTLSGIGSLQAVTHGAGVFVAVASDGSILRSSDAASWAPAVSGTGNALFGVAHGPHGFVAVGSGGTILTSPDGLAWQPRSSGTTESLSDVTFGPSGYVAIGLGSTVLTSTDGAVWTARDLGTANAALQDIAYGDGVYVATAPNLNDSIFLSTDAQTWVLADLTQHLLSAFSGGGSTAVGFGNGRFVITGDTGLILSSNPAADTFRIVTPPASKTIANNDVAELNVAATTGATSYQWYQGFSGDTSVPVGLDAPSFASLPLNASTAFWVRVTGPGGAAVDSATATLVGPPGIVNYPQPQTAIDGGSATFSVTALGTGPLTYQWEKNGTPIAGATGAAYTISPVSTGSAGNYRVVISGVGGTTATSAPVALTVTASPPSLSPQASLGLGSVVQSTSTVDLQMNVTGTAPVAVQWKKDGVNLGAPVAPDANNIAHHFIPSAQPSDVGVYTAIGSNSAGTSSEVRTHNAQFIVDESNWTWRNPSVRVTNAARLGDQFLVVGGRGFRATSSDGVTWTQQPSLGSPSHAGYVFGNGIHLIWGGSFILTSTDGQNWTSGFTGNWEFPNEIAFGNGLFVAAYPTGKVFTSADARTWTEHAAPFTGDLGVTFGNGRFLLGNDTSLSHSLDGIAWSPPTAMPFPEPTALRHLNGKFYLGNNAGALARSDDGETWTTLVSGTTHEILGLAYANNRYVCVGDSGTIITSDNGTDWTTRATPVTAHLGSVVFANNTWLAAGDANNTLLTSTDNGVTWTAQPIVATTRNLLGLASDGASHLVAVGANGTILRSTDGATWTAPASGTTNPLNDVTFAGGTYYAVGNYGTLLTSSDGTTWTPTSTLTSHHLQYIGQLDGRLFAAGGGGTVVSAGAGSAWSTTSTGITQQLNGLAFGNVNGTTPTFIAVGTAGTILKSATAASSSWSTVTSGTTAALNEVAYANNVFVAVGTGGTILRSADGSSWTNVSPAPSPEIFHSVRFINGHFIIGGLNGGVLVSTDGANWIARHTGNAGSEHRAFAIFNNQIFAAGDSGAILSTTLTPAIVQQPASQVAALGQPLQLRALVGGTMLPVSYQWKKGFANITGATTSTLTLPSVASGDAGSYSVVLTYPGGTLTSNAAAITTGTPPAITAQPTFFAQAATGTVNLSVTATGSSLTRQWYRGRKGDATTPVSTSATFTTPPLAESERYWVRVGNTLGSVDSDTLDVLALAPFNSPLSASAINGVTYGKGLYVAVANGNTILVSDDGTAWERVSGLAGRALRAVAFDGTRFVAVGTIGSGGTISVSTDGRNWAPATAPATNTSELNGVCHDGHRWVAVGANSTILTSPDGDTWTAQPGIAPANLTLRAITAGAGKLVAVGAGGVVYTSPTDAAGGGVTWTAVTGLATTAQLNAITYAKVGTADTFIAVGASGTVVASTDGGATWALAPLGGTPPAITGLSSVTFGNGKFIAAGAGYFTSADGTTWSASNSFALNSGATMNGAVYANGRFVLGGFGAAIWTSTTGDNGTWSLQNSAVTLTLQDFVYANGRYIGVSNGGAIVSWAADGSDPRTETQPVGFRRLLYVRGLFIAVGNNGRILTSTDAVNWTSRIVGSADYTALAHGNGQFIAAGEGGAYANSTDGLTWTQNPGVIGTANILGLDHGHGRFVATNAAGEIYASIDGTSWSVQTSGVTTPLNRVIHGPAGFVAVGNGSTILTAPPDALTWTKRTFSATAPASGLALNDVAYGDGLYVVVHNGGTGTSTAQFLVSRDAQTWHAVSNSSISQGTGAGVTFGNGSFLIGGVAGQLARTLPFADTLRILTPPAGQTFASGESVTLNVHAVNATDYQWFEGPGGDLSKPVSGATAATFVTGPLTESKRFWVRVSGLNGAVDSAAVELLGPPAILTAPPAALAVSDGGSATLSVSAFGSGPLTYQWKHDGIAIPGATASSHTFTVTPNSGGSYTVVIGDGTSSVTSPATAFTVVPIAPSLAQQASLGLGTIVQANSVVDLQFNVTGTPPVTVKWQKDGIDLTGSTGLDAGNITHHHLLGIRSSDTGQYTAIATNAAGTTVSAPNNQAQFVSEESNWQWHNPRVFSGTIFDVGVLNNHFVLTGNRGFRARSADGITWTQQPSLFTNTANSYVSGNGVTLLFGGPTIARSTDGENWTVGHLGRFEIVNEIVFAQGLFVAICTSGKIYTSPDALSWTERASSSTEPLFEATFGNGTFVVSTATGQLMTSTDGVTWTAPAPSPFANTWLLRFANGKFFLGDSAGGLATSTNGTDWTLSTSGVTTHLTDLAYSDGNYIIVGAAGAILTSTDGATWVTRPSGTTANLGAVAHLNGVWVATANNANTILSSTNNGATWTLRSSAATTAMLNAAAAAPNGSSLVAVGNVSSGSGVIVRSIDGATWLPQTSGTSSQLNGVTYFFDSYLAVGNGGTILTSSEGTSWSSVSSGVTANLMFVGELNGSIHAAGASGTILTRNAGAWSAIASGTTQQLNGLAYGPLAAGAAYVAVGNNGTILKSTDGATWSPATSGTTQPLNSVAFGANAFVAVGGGGTILRSIDGATWTPVAPQPTLPETFRHVRFSDGVFIVSGSGAGVFVSTDGLAWTPRYAGLGNTTAFRSTVTFKGRVYGVGGSGAILSASLQPVVAQPPQSQIFATGGTADFHVLAAGSVLPTTYQWRKNGVAIVGQTTPRLTLATTQASDVGSVYDVILTNSAGSIVSGAASLASPDAAVLDAPIAQRAVAGGEVEFRVSASGTGPFTYQWSKDGTDLTAATNASLRLTGLTAADAGSYSIRVANATGGQTSAPAALTILTPDNVLWQQFTEWSPEQAPGRTVHDGKGMIYVPWTVRDQIPDVVGGKWVGALARLNEIDGTLDPSFRLDRRYRRASHAAVQADGKVLVAVSAGDSHTVIRVDPTGAIAPGFNAPLFARGIRFITLQPDGNVLVATSDSVDANAPTAALGAEAPAVFRLNGADGSLDAGFTPAVLNSTGIAFAPPVLDSSNRIYLAGAFSSVNGTPRSNIARLAADGTLDDYAAPATLPAGFTSAQARGIALQADGRTIVVGDFRFTGRGASTDPIMAIRLESATGALDTGFAMPLRSELGFNPALFPRARHLVVQPDDAIVFVSDRLVRLTANGAVDPTFVSRAFDRESFWVSQGSGNRLYVPDQIGATGNGIASFNTNGTPHELFQTGGWGRTSAAANGVVLGDGRVWVSGTFNRFGAAIRPGLAQFNADGTLTAAQVASTRSLAFATVASAGGDNVFTILGQPASSTQPDGVPALVRVLPNGAFDAAFVPALPAGYGLGTASLEAAPDGKLLLAQAMVSGQAALNGATGDSLLRLNADGSRDTGYAPELSSFAVVERNATTSAVTMIRTGGLRVAQVLPDSSALIVVSSVDGTLKLLRLTPAGAVDSTFNPPSFGTIAASSGFTNGTTHDPITHLTAQFPITIYSASDLIRAAVQLPDGKVYVGGRFLLDGAPRGLVRLNADGTLDSTFTGEGIASARNDGAPFVTALAVDSSGRVYVAGRFDHFNGTAVPGIFRLGADGALDPAWSAGFSVLDANRSAVQLLVAGHKLYALGAVGSASDALPAVFRVAAIPPPAMIQSISPATAGVGTTITIDGIGFTSASSVKFGSVNASSFTVVSDTQITAVVPAFATTGPISVTTSSGTALTSADTLTIPQGSRVLASSIRAHVGAGENALLANVSIEGSAPRTILIRAIGPTLATLGITGALSDPQLTLHDGTGAVVASNDNWGGTTALANASAAAGALALSSSSRDAALLVSLAPGTYTARVTGVGGVTGEALVEVYDMDATDATSRTVHIASRTRTTNAATSVTGFVLDGGTGSKTVLIRAVGSALGTPGALSNPILTVRSGTTTVATNDDWTANSDLTALAAATTAAGAMPLAASDSALLLTLEPGTYTAEATGGTGIVMTEVFVIDGYRAATSAPALLAPLQSQTLTLGQDVTFAAPFVAKPSNVSFQWKKNGDAIDGATAQTYTLANATLAAAGDYSVVISGTGSTTTAAATLAVNAAPAIATQPVALTIVAGQTATFTVAASGFPLPTYQWRRNGLNLAGATAASLTLPNVAFNAGGDYTVVVTNALGSVTSTAATLTVNPIAPVITSPAAASGIRGRSFMYQVTSTSTQATYSASGLPTGLTIDPATGSITGIPTAEGTFNVTVAATNITQPTVETSNSKLVTLTILPPPPIINSAAAASARVNTTFAFTVLAVNMPAGSTFSAAGLPAGLALDAATGEITGTPTAAGAFSVVLSATNATGTVTSPFLLTIAPPLNVPTYSGPAQLSAVQGATFSFTPTFANGVTSYAATGLPAGLTLDSATGIITGTPSITGVSSIQFSATNSGGTSAVTLSLTVNPAPTAPVVTSASTATATVGSGFSFTLTATQSPTSWAATGLPTGFSLDAATGTITGTPAAPGTIAVQVRAANDAGSGPQSVLVIAINPAANAPILTSAPVVQGRVGDAFSSTLAASNSPTSFVQTSGTLPAGLTLDSATGAITGTPTQVGQRRVWFAATNATGQGLALEVLFSIAPADTTPVINSNGTVAGQAGQPFSYVITATNGPTAFALASGTLPAGLQLDTSTGVISGIPAEATTNPAIVTLTATSGTSTSSPKTLTITIAPAPATPVITSALTASGRVGAAFSYQVTASENATSFVALDLPDGLALDNATGAITGSPTVSGPHNLTLRASNAAGLGAPSTLALSIAPAAAAPSITSAASASGKVGAAAAFNYAITASTPVGSGPVTGYGLTGTLPLGLSFNTSTGILSGRPAAAGIFTVQLTATNDGGTSLPQSLVLNIAPADNVPIITSAIFASATAGQPFSYQITAASTPAFPATPFPAPFILDAVNLPDGLAVNPSTGLVQGVPMTAGVFTATLVGTNEAGTGPFRDLTIFVQPGADAPVVTSLPSAAAQVGTPFSYQITGTNSPTSFEVLGAPAWMNVNGQTGAIAGSPTTPGSFSVQLLASNATGASNPVTLFVTVAPAANTPVVTSTRTAAGQVGAAFTYTVTASNTPTAFVATGLPAGLSLNAATGAISGTPTTSGQFEVTLLATNANGTGQPVTLILTVQPNVTFTL